MTTTEASNIEQASANENFHAAGDKQKHEGSAIDDSSYSDEKKLSGDYTDLEHAKDGADIQQQNADHALAVTFPDGGLQAWATVAGAFCVQFCGFGYTSSFGVYQDYYVREYLTDYTSSEISWIGSTQVFIGIAGGLFAGQLFDRGYFKFTVYAGAFLISLALFMLSLAKQNSYYQIILSQGICMGIGVGLIYVPSIAVISHYFHKRRTLAMAIVACGTSLGSIVHPIMLNNTLHSSFGFGNSVRASAGLVTGMLLIACCLMRTRLPPPKKTTPIIPSLKKFAGDSAYVTATAALFFVATGFYYVLYYLQLNAILHQVPRSLAFYSLVILNVCQLIGRLSTGFAAHRFGTPIVMSIATGGCGAIVWGMIGIHNVASVVTVGIFFGLFAGSYQALQAPLVAVLADNVSEIGVRLGISFAFLAVGALIGSPICGALLTHKYLWWRATIFSSVMMFTGFGFFVFTCIILKRRDKLFH